MTVESADVILVRSNPLDVVTIVQLSRATYRKMIQNLLWARRYNVVAIPLAAGVLYAWGVLLTSALGAVLVREYGDCGRQRATAETEEMTKLLKNGNKIVDNTKQRENRNQKTVTTTTKKET